MHGTSALLEANEKQLEQITNSYSIRVEGHFHLSIQDIIAAEDQNMNSSAAAFAFTVKAFSKLQLHA